MTRNPLPHVPMLFFLLVVWASVSGANAPGLQDKVADILDEEGLTGIAWTLVAHDDVSLGAAGMRDNELGQPWTTDTRFHVGSLTKTVVATGILKMATEGLLELDAPAAQYLGGLNFQNPWSGTSKVTIRHLLDHTAGLSDAQFWQMFSLRPTPGMPLSQAFPDPLIQLQVRSRPGSRFSYSNSGYTLLGMIIESISGVRYEVYLDEQVLGPLGMQNSTLTFTTQEGEAADPMLAWGHVDDGSRYAASPIFLRPAGQLTSTAGDLGVFADFLMGNGSVNGHVFIDKELMRARGQPVTTLAKRAGLEAGYSLGLGRRDRHGVVGFCHGGNIVGFVAMLCIFPEQNKAFAYSINTDSETANYERFNQLFIDALEIERLTSPAASNVGVDMGSWLGWYVLSPNRFASFEYLDRVFGAVRVSASKDGLNWRPIQGRPRQLYPVADRVFRAEDRSTASHVFMEGENGEKLASDGFRTFERVSLLQLALHWLSAGLGLAGMIWVFLAGTARLAFKPRSFPGRPIAPAVVASYLLLVPIPLFLIQPFMALGDVTLASTSLFAVTLLFPVGLLLTILRGWKSRKGSGLAFIDVVASILALQWCVVLFIAGMLPLRLWAL